MIRPRNRPTVSRRNKYLSIAPRAEKKLSREGRRGSHDLRRLVGHANFLDVLVDSLDERDADEEAAEAAESLPAASYASSEPTEPADDELSDDSSTASEEEWSDDSDDNDHTLVRTGSSTSLVDLARAARAETGAGIVASGDDYFSRVRYAEEMAKVDDSASVVENNKNAAITITEVTTSLSDLMKGLGHGRSPSEQPRKGARTVEGVVTEGATV